VRGKRREDRPIFGDWKIPIARTISEAVLLCPKTGKKEGRGKKGKEKALAGHSPKKESTSKIAYDFLPLFLIRAREKKGREKKEPSMTNHCLARGRKKILSKFIALASIDRPLQ